MAKRQTQTLEDRIAPYVNSPLMTQRVRSGKEVSARVEGNFGIYRTKTTLGKKEDGDCTCPSELWPCKHIYALRETWKLNPHSFFDLDQFLAELSEEPKVKLIEAIAQIVTRSPEWLSVFGVLGFEEVDEEEDDESDWEEE
jgi:hypothetical protein